MCGLNWLTLIELFVSAVQLICSASAAEHFADAAAAAAFLLRLQAQHAFTGSVFYGSLQLGALIPRERMIYSSRAVKLKYTHLVSMKILIHF